MHSIGNDVVDLNFIDKARTQSKPFYSKILSESEQQLFQTSYSHIPFWQYVWLLWSCKEAVYKFLKRHQPELVFSPARISLQPSPVAGRIPVYNYHEDILLAFAFQEQQYYTRSFLTSDYIATIAKDSPDISSVEFDVIRVDRTDYQYQSAEVRRHFLKKLAVLFPDAEFEIVKSETGYPVIYKNGSDTGILTSFAHHGNYVAYAFAKS